GSDCIRSLVRHRAPARWSGGLPGATGLAVVSEVDSSVHYAFYEFAGVEAARSVLASPGMRALVLEFDRARGTRVRRTRDILKWSNRPQTRPGEAESPWASFEKIALRRNQSCLPELPLRPSCGPERYGEGSHAHPNRRASGLRSCDRGTGAGARQRARSRGRARDPMYCGADRDRAWQGHRTAAVRGRTAGQVPLTGAAFPGDLDGGAQEGRLGRAENAAHHRGTAHGASPAIRRRLRRSAQAAAAGEADPQRAQQRLIIVIE